MCPSNEVLPPDVIKKIESLNTRDKSVYQFQVFFTNTEIMPKYTPLEIYP